MKEKILKLTRRKFLIAGSAAIASPLLLDAASSTVATKTAEAKTTKTKFAKGTKIYYISRDCIGCQV